MKLYESIYELKNTYSLTKILQVLKINRSSYYYWLKNKENREEKKIKFYHSVIKIYSENNGIYGAPKIKAELQDKGIECSVSKVGRALKTLGLQSITKKRFPKKNSSITGEERRKIVNLIKGIKITNKNQVWTTDITNIKTISEGNYNLITFIDQYTKKVVSWGLHKRQTTDIIISILKEGERKEKPKAGIIIHSDKGMPMRSKEYREYLSKKRMVYSYTSLNHSCDENAAQESFHAQMKKECIYQTKIYTYEQAKYIIATYIQYYNNKRRHSSIGYKTPAQFDKNLSNTPYGCPKK